MIIKLEPFEGPLDLLFHLIEKNKINIYDIPIAQLTDQYMEYLYQMKEFNLEIASEFLVMAATLLHIKSRLMLPVEKSEEAATEDEGDPREELMLKLLMYKRIKLAGEELRVRAQENCKFHYKSAEVYNFKRDVENEELQSGDLVEVYKNILIRNEAKTNKQVFEKIDTIVKVEKVSLKSKIREVIRLIIDKTRFKFNDEFNLKKRSKLEVVTGFMAILELAKLRKVTLTQKDLYEEILVEGATENDD